MTRERPILFSAPMVRAILEGRKTQTRRIVKPQPRANYGVDAGRDNRGEFIRDVDGQDRFGPMAHCRYGQTGDRLWVRESWQFYDWTDEGEPCLRYAADNATSWPAWQNIPEESTEKLVDTWEDLSCDENYSIDKRASDRRWRPSIHMPRWASRILLEVTDVRVKRLQDMSEGDAIAEGWPKQTDQGADTGGNGGPFDWYRSLWDSINGAGSWDTNPWVWAITFRRIEAKARE